MAAAVQDFKAPHYVAAAVQDFASFLATSILGHFPLSSIPLGEKYFDCGLLKKKSGDHHSFLRTSPPDFNAPIYTASAAGILTLRFVRRRLPRFCKFPCSSYFRVFASNVNSPKQKSRRLSFICLASSTTPRGLRQNKHGLLGKDPHRFPSCGPSRPRGPISLWAASCFAYSRSNNRASSP